MSTDTSLRAEVRRLAEAHARAGGGQRESFITQRIRELERGFDTTYRVLAAARWGPGDRPGAVEWLLDNDYVIQENLNQVRGSLPTGYYRRLALAGSGTWPRRPRVYALAKALVDGMDRPLVLDEIDPLLTEYQEVTPLTIGELWALPAMLRLAILEALAPSAAEVAAAVRGDADADPDQDLAWAIRALRDISTYDWKVFVEEASRVERVLRRDRWYGSMSFETRDRYREAVERLARGSATHDEEAVARAALRLAGEAQPHRDDAAADERRAHVGTYLLAEGRAALEREIDHVPDVSMRLRRSLGARALGIYMTAILLVWAVVTLVPMSWLFGAQGGVASLLFAVLFAIGPALALAVALVDWLVTLIVPPRKLPRLDADELSGPGNRTLAVMPVIVSTSGEVDVLLARLEVHFLGNRRPWLTFALLTDFADAPHQEVADDAELLDALRSGIRALNERYATTDAPVFHLLHRERRWNPVERTWMGWERKRGKLEELNVLITGAGTTSFAFMHDEPADLRDVRFVITLDADTRLPPGTAAELVAAFRHPLNRPVVEGETGRLLAGYTVLQPRIENDPTLTEETSFMQVMATTTGVDLYSQSVSDVYHDLVGEAVFVGKGIYDVPAFERCLRGRAPENRLLSHDLFEGVHGSVGLASSVVLYEQYPANALVYARRLHRWIRGDWQLLPWLLSRRLPGGERDERNTLSLLDRWKIGDNLRRSVHQPIVLALFVIAWLAFEPGVAAATTLGIVLFLAIPMLFGALAAAYRGVAGRAWRSIVESGGHAVMQEARRWALSLVLLAHESIVSVDAVARTLYRMAVSRRGLLEWTTAAHAAGAVGTHVDASTAWRRMASTPILSLTLLFIVAAVAPGSLGAALPFLLVWALSPLTVAGTSRSTQRPSEALREGERRELRLIARRTWLFFETMVDTRDHWLPPDHYQEDPGGVVARRTSPTNIGMLLVSTLSAYDLGFLGARGLASRVANTLDTLDRLPRYRGHWLNWYDTQRLTTLEPRYVSTVDSGNLAAALMALGRGLEEIRTLPLPNPRRLHGVGDTLAVLSEVVEHHLVHGHPATAAGARSVMRRILTFEHDLRAARDAPLPERLAALERLVAGIPSTADELLALIDAHRGSIAFLAIADMRSWVEHALSESRAIVREVSDIAPWLPLVAAPPAIYTEAPPGSALGDAAGHLLEILGTPLDLDHAPELLARSRSIVADLEVRLARLPKGDAGAQEARRWNREVIDVLQGAIAGSEELSRELGTLSQRCLAAAREMDFAFLYDPARDLFRIGYHVSAGEYDRNYYDLLASEARTASLLAIAKGEAPVAHWLQLGRPIARLRGSRVLLSWSATMFEYLMPPLMLRNPHRTLLHESCRGAVGQQIAFAKRHRVPWGISESAFAELGTEGDYQYRAFGVPRIGLRSDPGQRLVIAPYASALALPVQPRAVVANFRRIVAMGGLGRYGLIESLDFGPVDSATRTPTLVRTYMSHHQGMIMVAAANHLLADRMVERLHTDPEIASVELLLHEQIPVTTPPQVRWRRPAPVKEGRAPPAADAGERWSVEARSPTGTAMPLSNGTTLTLADEGGLRWSRWGSVLLTRSRGEAGGQSVYVRDEASGELWSTTLSPTGGDSASCSATFGPDMVSYRRHHADILTRDDVAVAERDYAQVRRVTLTNQSDRVRRLWVTSYAEVVLGDDAEDVRHPGFVRLFVESAFRSEQGALVFRRRGRTPEERAGVMVHGLVAPASVRETLRWLTDRRAFLGRGGSARAPLALMGEHDAWSSDDGSLDPVMALDCRVELEPQATVELAFVTTTGPSEEAAMATLQRFESPQRVAFAFERATAASDAELDALGLSMHDAADLSALLALALAPRPEMRAADAAAGTLEDALWPQGISGDRPIVLLRVQDADALPFVRNVLRGHAWWRGRQIGIDVVILDETSSGYDQPLRDSLDKLVTDMGRLGKLQGPGQVFVRAADQVGDAVRELLTAARVVLDASAGTLSAQIGRVQPREPMPAFSPLPGSKAPSPEIPGIERPEGLHLDNGFGGFAGGGAAGANPAAANPATATAAPALHAGAVAEAGSGDADYVIHLEPGQLPPAPWINVIANASFGFMVSESGASCTWGRNSGEHRLTPWGNDPVSDPTGEAFFLRDEETGAVWSPTPAPAPAPAAYRVRHGAGRTVFDHHSHGLEQELETFVHPDESVKLTVLRLRDRWDRPRRITLTAYVEWVLGTTRARHAPYIVPEFDPDTGALFARSLVGPLADGSTAFLVASGAPHSLTTDRAEFLGPDEDLARPDALGRIGLSGTVRFGVDPCAALQVHLDIDSGGTAEVHFALGLARDRDEALELARRFKRPEEARRAADGSADLWRERLDTITVRTPEHAIDHMLNRWLPYQALSCRIWGRTALYQSSGAFGFRDQLQDVANLVGLAPDLAREQLLRAAAQQFEEGDVRHWWHADSGFGVRTRCSDDLLWLPWACARYIEVTGDAEVLRERVPYLTGPELGEGEHEKFGRHEHEGGEGTLLDHCLRAIARGDTRGPHGLPLIGSGDWNDGMNRLGIAGRGESVWLGWFLCTALEDGARLCELAGERERAEELRARRRELAADVNDAGWDGKWYRRAYDDDGRPVGSAERSECRIDLIAQAWSVLSGAGDPERRVQAMASAREELWRPDEGIFLLLKPPFDRGGGDPGYIRSYPPGVRENGGQYTHGAIWGAWAFAALGDGAMATTLLRQLSPASKTATADDVARYRTEPYAVAADVYGVPPRLGRGGWTWYTGAAGWLYRFGIEAVLGLRRRDGHLEIDPCIAPDWPGFGATVRVGDARYEVEVENPDGVARGVRSIHVDGRPCTDGRFPLVDDGRTHEVLVRLGAPR